MPETTKIKLDSKQFKELRAIELHVFNHVYALAYVKDHNSPQVAASQALAAAEHARTTWLNKRMIRDLQAPEGTDWQAPEA